MIKNLFKTTFPFYHFIIKGFIQKLLFAFILFTIQSKAQTGAALNFDGVDDKVDLGATLGNLGTGNFTFETWFKSTATGDRCLVSKRAACTASNFWNVRLINGAVHFEVCANGAQSNLLSLQTPLNTYNNGNWYHVACTRNSNVYTLYINGVQVAQGVTGTTSYSNAIALTLGAGPCGNFIGTLDETRIWSVARSSYEIQSKYTCELTGPQAGLTMSFHFNQGIASGANALITNLSDASGNNNDGTLVGFTLNGATSNWILPGGVVSGVACTSDPLQAFQLNGNGGQGWLGGECYQLTANQQGLFGSMWYRKKADLTKDFDISANLNFGTNNSPGADGITFAFQNVCTSSGSAGQDIGIGGVSPSLVVEFDTYQNTVYGDPSIDHIAIQKNGDLNHGGANALVAPVQIDPANVDVENGQDYQVRILWTVADSTLKIFVNGNLRSTYTGNIVNQIFGGNAYVYWGFTAGTGGEFNLQKVCMLVLPNNEVSLEASAGICTGGSYQANVPGYASYSWVPSTGVSNTTIANPVLSPATNTIYTLTVTDACNNQQTQVISISVNPVPVVTAGGTATVCAGTATPLNASGADSFEWSPATGLDDPFSATPLASPAVTTTYTVTGTSIGCSATATVTITVNTSSATVASANATICAGSSISLSASGADTYLWSPAISLDDATVFNPTATPLQTTAYIVIGTANGCTSSDTVVITVNPYPIVNVSSPTICIGEQATLTSTVSPSGGFYIWSTGSFGSTLSVIVQVNTIFGLNYEVGGCTTSATGTVTVNPVPIADAGPDGQICPGAGYNLSAIGGSTFSWSPSTGLSSSTISNPIASPASTTTYTVTVGNSFSCTSTDLVTVTVVPLAVNAGADASVVCGSPITLNGTGAINYSWSPTLFLSDSTISNPIASPTSTTTYTLTASNGACSDSDEVTITVLGLTATAGSDALICSGQSQPLLGVATASPGIYQNVHTGYNFSSNLGLYGSITGGTVLWNSSSPTIDDVVSAAIPIPPFPFNNIVYNNLYVSSYGFITFGSAPSATNYAPISSSEAYAGCVAAFAQDLGAYSFSTSAEVRYQFIGNDFIVQWKNMGRYSGNSVDEQLSFQIILNTSTNQISIIYSTVIVTGTSTAYPQVGLRGPDSGFIANVNNRTIPANGGAWTNNTTAGTSNSSTCAMVGFPNNTKPQNGTVFSWTPQIFLQPTYSWTPTTGLSNPSIAFPLASPTASTLYTLAVNYGACTSTSTVNITVDSCLGFVPNENLTELQIFPNPASSEISITMETLNSNFVQLELLDLTGKMVYKEQFYLNKGNNKQILNLSPYTSGMYILKLQTGDKIYLEKLRIQH